MIVEPIGLWRLLSAAIFAFSMFTGRAAAAEQLHLVTFPLPPFTDLSNESAPGFSVEVLRQVFAAMGKEVTFEQFPISRGWSMVLGGQRDGIFITQWTSDRAQKCYLPEEAPRQERWVFFIRTADAERLRFSSFDDLVGHDIAFAGPIVNGSVMADLRKVMDEHHNKMIETTDPPMVFRMLADGHIDYVIVNLAVGMWETNAMGLSGKVEPILSRSVMDDAYRVCFNKMRVDQAFVDAFSNALKQFAGTEAYEAISRKYFP